LKLQIADHVSVGWHIAQFEQQRDSSRRTLYVKGSWLCSLLYKITAAFGNIIYPTRSSELEVRIRPAALLHASQDNALPKIFEDGSHGIAAAHLWTY